MLRGMHGGRGEKQAVATADPVESEASAMGRETRRVQTLEVEVVQKSGRENKVGGAGAAGVESRGMHVEIPEQEEFTPRLAFPESQEVSEQGFPKEGPCHRAPGGVRGVYKHSESYGTALRARQPEKSYFSGEAECNVKGGKPPMYQHSDISRTVAGTRSRGG